MVLRLVRLVFLVLQLLAGTGGGYFALLTVATFLQGKSPSGSGPASRRFAILVPAHNEALTVSNTLKSLMKLDYPGELYEVFVVADNCQDATAEIAQEFRCTVWERTDPKHRSKGHALNWAFGKIPEKYEAVVIVDADSEVNPELLTEFSRVYDPSVALQGLYLQSSGLGATPTASYVASALHNGLKPYGREKLGCSVGLGGNGMCFPRNLIREVPWQRFGLAEDAEYHLDLVLAGKRVRFAPGAGVEAEAPGNFKSLQSQRSRWEGGRTEVFWRFTRPLIVRAARKRDLNSLEALLSYAAPPFSLTVSASLACLAYGLLRCSTSSRVVGAFGLIASVAAVLRALNLIQASTRIYLYLPTLPLFVAWRTWLSFKSIFPGKKREWRRTERAGKRA